MRHKLAPPLALAKAKRERRSDEVASPTTKPRLAEAERPQASGPLGRHEMHGPAAASSRTGRCDSLPSPDRNTATARRALSFGARTASSGSCVPEKIGADTARKIREKWKGQVAAPAPRRRHQRRGITHRSTLPTSNASSSALRRCERPRLFARVCGAPIVRSTSEPIDDRLPGHFHVPRHIPRLLQPRRTRLSPLALHPRPGRSPDLHDCRWPRDSHRRGVRTDGATARGSSGRSPASIRWIGRGPPYLHDWLWELHIAGTPITGFFDSNRILEEAIRSLGWSRLLAHLVRRAVDLFGWPLWIHGEHIP